MREKEYIRIIEKLTEKNIKLKNEIIHHLKEENKYLKEEINNLKKEKEQVYYSNLEEPPISSRFTAPNL